MATASLFKSLFRLVRIGLYAVLVFWVLTFAAGFWFAPVSTLMWARYITFRVVDQRFLPLSEISPNLIRAVAMSEDGQYCQHGGVDWEARLEASIYADHAGNQKYDAMARTILHPKSIRNSTFNGA